MLNHVELIKPATDTHPQTGETQEMTILDLYKFQSNPKEVIVWGWGTFRTCTEPLNKIVEILVSDGFKAIE